VPTDKRPQLIGLDLDGTVVDHLNEVMPAVREQLQACHRAGIALAFLTGRRPHTAGKHLDAIGLPALAATNSGCLLWEYPGWKQLARRMFPAALVQPIAEMLAPYSANFYVDASQAGFEFFCLDRQPTPALDEYLKRWAGQARRITDPAEMAGYEITQVAMPAPDDEVLRLRDAIRGRYDGQVLALAVHWPLVPARTLELFSPEANKGSALRYFAERLGIGRDRVLAIGDDVNDQAMIEWAAHGVAMPGSTGGLERYADEVLEGDKAQALAGLLGRLRGLPA
jgi:HAD superfamily hydrolase (TIGR01484 family)